MILENDAAECPHDWQQIIAATLHERGVAAAAYVPDTRLDGILVRLGQLGTSLRSLSREEECIGYACGQLMAGARAAALFQSSGLGNAVNALAGLAVPYRLGVPLIISMRGTLGEANPSQIPGGRIVVPILDALGIQSFMVRRADEVGQVVAGVLTLCFDAHESAAVLLGPELGGGREGT